MTEPTTRIAPEVARAAQRLARHLRTSGRTMGVAESLTSGRLAEALGAQPGSSDWFVGGVVAYTPAVKFEVLGVTPGPVVTRRCAAEMAEGAARLLGVDLAVALTGVGGPAHEEGHPPGTVFIAVHANGATEVEQRHLPGDPARVLDGAVRAALDLTLRCATRSPATAERSASRAPSGSSRTPTVPRRAAARRSR